jgi:hypothetical protein
MDDPYALMPRDLWKHVLMTALTTGQGLANSDDPNWEAGDEFHPIVALNTRLTCRALYTLMETDDFCPRLEPDWMQTHPIQFSYAALSGRVPGAVMNAQIATNQHAESQTTTRCLLLRDLVALGHYDRVREYLLSFQTHPTRVHQLNTVWACLDEEQETAAVTAMREWLVLTCPAKPVYNLRIDRVRRPAVASEEEEEKEAEAAAYSFQSDAYRYNVLTWDQMLGRFVIVMPLAWAKKVCIYTNDVPHLQSLLTHDALAAAFDLCYHKKKKPSAFLSLVLQFKSSTGEASS